MSPVTRSRSQWLKEAHAWLTQVASTNRNTDGDTGGDTVKCSMLTCEDATGFQCDNCSNHMCNQCAIKCLKGNVDFSDLTAFVYLRCPFCRWESTSEYFDALAESSYSPYSTVGKLFEGIDNAFLVNYTCFADDIAIHTPALQLTTVFIDSAIFSERRKHMVLSAGMHCCQECSESTPRHVSLTCRRQS